MTQKKAEGGHMPSCIKVMRAIFSNRTMLGNLARNDFKTRFAGSYLGIFWAFVQPIVTVVLYWFVFEKALGASSQMTKAGIQAPYVLWLIAGLIPWFYFSDVLSGGTNCLMEYNYLVKKVVFDVDVLPVVKAMSALFVHIFFIGFMVLMYVLFGMFPGVYFIQTFYYSFCTFVFALALIYFTSAIAVFFRDLNQIVNILLQILIWATPIMWNIDAVSDHMNPVILTLLRLNPLYYIVNGYRDSMISKIWFFEHGRMTLYFWVVTLLLFWIGTAVFERLKPHFADVL